MSACRNSWATVRPGAAPAGSRASIPRSTAASRATAPRSSSVVRRSRTSATAAGSAVRSPSAATAAARTVGCSTVSPATSSSARPEIGPGTRPRVSTSLLRTAAMVVAASAPSTSRTALVRGRDGPTGEGALGEDAGEAAIGHDPDQPADRVEARQPGPGAQLACSRRNGLGCDRAPTARRRPVVEHPGQGVHGRHRGQLVRFVDRRGEQRHRFRSCAGGGGCEVVRAAQHVHDERCLLDLVEGAQKRQGHACCSEPTPHRMPAAGTVLTCARTRTGAPRTAPRSWTVPGHARRRDARPADVRPRCTRPARSGRPRRTRGRGAG